MKEEMVISRVARQHYGMRLEVPYDYSAEQRLLGLDRLIFEPAEGNRAFVTGRMEWMVRRVSCKHAPRETHLTVGPRVRE